MSLFPCRLYFGTMGYHILIIFIKIVVMVCSYLPLINRDFLPPDFHASFSCSYHVSSPEVYKIILDILDSVLFPN